MNAWLAQHQAAFLRALRRLLAAPLNTLLSLLVIAIALTLPGAGHVLLDDLRELGRGTASVQQISLFMTLDASKRDVAEIETRLRAATPGTWRFVPREEALKRIRAMEGMDEVVASLPRNPLPDAFIIEPENIEPAALEVMRKELASWPKVAHVQLDADWVKRFDALLKLGKALVVVLAAVFATGLVAATFNTIRLQLLARTAEIEVARLVGATDAFIRRPFYYFGALQGALGGLLASVFVALILNALAEPAAQLATLYGTAFTLGGPRLLHVALLTGAGGFLGWLGAQLSVSLSLRQLG